MIFGITIALFVCTIALFACGIIFEAKLNWNWPWTAFKITGLLFIIGLIVCVICHGNFARDVREMKEDYGELMIYNDAIALSVDERARFGHYERIKEYNEDYKRMERNKKSIWVSSFVPNDWNEGIALIDFYFLGGN